MPGFLLDLLVLLITLVVVAVVIGVIIWALQKMYPETPPVVINGLYVIGVLIALYLIVSWVYTLPFVKRIT